MCNADPLCKAFVYLPNGIDSLSEVGCCCCPAGLCRVAGWPAAAPVLLHRQAVQGACPAALGCWL